MTSRLLRRRRLANVGGSLTFFCDPQDLQMLRRVLLVATIVAFLALCFCSGFVASQEAAGNDHEGRRLISGGVADNPFMSPVCMDMIQDSTLQISVTAFSVVIVARNEKKELVLKTVKSVVRNDRKSNKATLKNIILVDDFSYEPINAWPEWGALKAELSALKDALTIVRLNYHSGTAHAKNRGVDEVQKKIGGDSADNHGVVFLDAHSIVSPQWLVPLASSLSRYPKALVYPVNDILTVSTNAAGVAETGVIRAEDNLVAAFDWALNPRWEPLSAAPSDSAPERVRSAPHTTENGAVEVISPAAPGIFAVRLAYFLQLGKFDSTLYNTYYSPSETIELSLRAWLCGGMVLKQSCSRVAHRSANLFAEAPVGNGVTQGSVDRAVLNVAQKWLQGTATLPASYTGESVSYQELSFRARFVNRVPYAVEIANDPILISPPQSIQTSVEDKKSKLHVCLPFQWFLQEVYPGLLADAPGVLDTFAAYLNTDYMSSQSSLNALLGEYNKPLDLQKDHPVQSGLLSVRASKLAKLAAISIGAGTAVRPSENFLIKKQFIEPPGPKVPTRSEQLFEHTRLIHEQLECTDFPEKDFAKSCEAQLHGEPDMCTDRKADVLFRCPKTCGFCAKEDGKFCEDFYLNKCVSWQAEGKCEETIPDYGVVREICRKSCHACTPVYMAGAAGSNSAGQIGNAAAQKKPIEIHIAPVSKPDLPVPPKIPEMSAKEAEMMQVDIMIHAPLTINPEYLQEQYKAGEVEDHLNFNREGQNDENHQCAPMDKADAQLLSRVVINPATDHVDSEGKPLRIFCGIYTMESSHETNVKATRNTWAKKCDGFIAFSTKEDPLIPSVAILHEGKEAYDNMWQKSRSIWRFIHTHLSEKYDFFLLGGDDMFYIVENLRAYLGSEEITKKKNEGQGLYIGRIFQPPNQIVFNSGGAGYLLDQKALQVLGKNIDSPKCFPHQTGFWEDVNVANCLKKSTPSILPYDTRDPQLRERFHPFTPGLQLSYRIPPVTPDWYAKYNPELKVGFDCCSDGSISFHYVKEKLMYRLYNYVYHCDNKIR